MRDPMAKLDALERLAALGGGEDRLRRQHEAGKLVARERMELLFDPGTFEEVDKLVTHRCLDFGMAEQIVPGDGVVSGHGRVDGRVVYAFAQDFTVFGGSLSETNAAKIVKIMDMAMKAGAPIVGLNDSGGARIQEGVLSLAGYADIFLRNTLASGVVPQISAVMGPCIAGGAYLPALSDIIIMVEGTSFMGLGGANLVKGATGQVVDAESLGGSATHTGISAVAHYRAKDDRDCLNRIREYISRLPHGPPPRAPSLSGPAWRRRNTPGGRSSSRIASRPPIRISTCAISGSGMSGGRPGTNHSS